MMTAMAEKSAAPGVVGLSEAASQQVGGRGANQAVSTAWVLDRLGPADG